jgi:hypothetical protein
MSAWRLVLKFSYLLRKTAARPAGLGHTASIFARMAGKISTRLP